MILKLNEQEIIDGVCVFVSNYYEDIDPCEVDVLEINYNKDEGFSASYTHSEIWYTEVLNEDQICEGIIQFLAEYHCFDPEVTIVKLDYHKKNGFSAEVLVNEDY